MLNLKPALMLRADYPQEILEAFKPVVSNGTVKAMRIRLRDTPPAYSFNTTLSFDLYDEEYQSYHNLTWGEVVKRADPCHILTGEEIIAMGEAALSVVTSKALEDIFSGALPQHLSNEGELHILVFDGCLIISSENYTRYVKNTKYLDPVDLDDFARTLCTIIAPTPPSNHAAIKATSLIQTALKFWRFDPPDHILNNDLEDVTLSGLTDQEIGIALAG